MQSGISNLEQLQTILENVDSAGNVIAPASGTITSLSAVENGYVSPSVPVAVIDGVDQMKVTVDVSEALVPKLAVGDEADVSVSSLSLTFTGTIRSIDRSASLQTKLYTVTLSIPADVEGLLSGMFADVTFRTDTSHDAVVVPTQAILNSGDTQYVFVVEGNEARYVQIETGLTGNGVTEVTSGLSAGQELVTVGQSYLVDGAAVRVVEQEA
jgi:RND family efflux transporter MFP subunit